MIFNSLDFAVFLPIVFFCYWLVGVRRIKLQNLILLGASYIFYAWWDWKFLGLIVFSSFTDYYIALGIVNQTKKNQKRLLLILSLLINLGLLGFFKYYNFFIENFTEAFSFLGIKINPSSLNIVLPVGISFYTFQTLSYTIDVYKGKLTPKRDVIAFLAFVSFFPQLVAGPIERASHLLPQFLIKRRFNYDQFSSGMENILWGLLKKVVIADRLAPIVNEIYNHPMEYHGFVLILGTVFFAFQIYCDFSGYSQIAIGTARLFGFDLMTNFSKPYLSKSLSEFWRRWHISLSTWFRDYIYIPLGGNKTNRSRWIVNILTVFILSGFWHGANWTFIVWGVIHGIVLVIEGYTTTKDNSKLMIVNTLRVIKVFIIVCFGWIFFRSNSITDAITIVKDILNPSNYHFSQLTLNIVPIAKNTVYPLDVLLSLILITVLILTELYNRFQYQWSEMAYWKRLLIYVGGVWLLIIGGVYENNHFIYFQF